MKARKPRTSRALLDVLLGMLGMILLLINTPTEGALDPKVDYVLEVSWPENVNVDIDVHILAPNNMKMSYTNKDIGHLSIDRDDLGKNNDPAPPNIEIVSWRALVDGLYYISIHNYRTSVPLDPKWKVHLVLRNEKGKSVWNTVIDMPSQHQERPVAVVEVVDKKVVDVRKSDRRIVMLRGF